MTRPHACLRRQFLLIVAGLTLTACAGAAPDSETPDAPAGALSGALSGDVSWRERMALPPGAVVEVRLLDVSRADAPARVLAETRIEDAVGSPVPFALSYDPAEITARGRYALRATIRDGEALLFTSTAHHAVFGSGPDQTSIGVSRAAPAPETDPAALVGAWVAEDIRGAGVIDGPPSTLDIAADGGVSGRAGCNGFRGQARIEGARFAVGPLAVTRMACPPAAMNQETRFLDALSATTRYATLPETGKLVLFDAEGVAVMRLARGAD